MRSTTRLLSDLTDSQIDLNDFAGSDGYLFVRDGVGVAGRGVAQRVDRNTAEDCLRNIKDDNQSGVADAGPIAIGCIPFISTDAHEFVIPKVVIGKTQRGDQWITTIDDAEFEALLDQLHGKGQGPAAVASAPASKPGTSEPQAAAAKPAPVEAKAAPVAAPAADKAAAAQQAAQAETTVRVDTKRLDQIMNMVGELVLVRNRLVSLSGTVQSEEMSKAISNLDVVTADIQGAVMKTRMQPIKKVFGRFPRVVRDLARSLQKDIELVLEGEETDLDKNLVEALADPLVHLVRNSVDHGIEMPDVRQKAGKKRTGTVKLAAAQAGDHILLTIHDDGAGMDPEKLKGIAIKNGETLASILGDDVIEAKRFH